MEKGCTFYAVATDMGDKEVPRQGALQPLNTTVMFPQEQPMARVPVHFEGSLPVQPRVCLLSREPRNAAGVPQIFKFQFHFKLVIRWLVIIKCYTNKANSDVMHAQS